MGTQLRPMYPNLLFVICLCAASFSAIAAERVPWTTSRVIGSPEKPPKYKLERRFSGLQFTNAVDFAYSRDLKRWLLAEQGGKVYTFDAEGKGLQLAADFLPLQSREGSFFAITFDPDFKSNSFLYVCYAQKSDLPDGSKVSRFRVKMDSEPKIDVASEEVLITWLSGGHNGCCLKFGNDGYLYISTGDGAGPNPPDPMKTGQDVSDLLSSILRIDVHHQENGKKYRVPPDNPFVGREKVRPEIWAYGFRNPWRMGFDRKTGELWVGDVGWELWELVYLVERGGNYGWSIFEGRQPVLPNDPRGPTPILPPIKDHPHSEAASITGGPVYYGKKFPEITGAFIYGDWETGKIWGIRAMDKKVTWSGELTDSTMRIIAFAEDSNDEIYVLDYNGGVYELMANPSADAPQNFPKKLSETGIFASLEKLAPAAGVYPFNVNAPMWSDFAEAQRWIALPGTSTVSTAERPWRYPSNAVLVRNITLEMERGNPQSKKRIETQLLHFTGDGWGAYSYRWNDEQTDAMLVAAEGADEVLKVKDATVPGGIRLQPWRFSGRSECLRCHNPWGGTALAFEPEQLGPQFDKLEELKLIAARPKDPVPQLVSPYDTMADLQARARSYLHINCAHCHRDGAGGSVPSFMQVDLPLEKMRLVDARPVLGDLGLKHGKVIAPGEPFSSVVLFRNSATGRSRMPYIGSEMVDETSIAVLREWIESLGGKSPQHAIEKLRQEVLTADPDQIAAKNFTSTSAALTLAHALSDTSVPLQTKERIARAAARSSNPLIPELFERFLPASERTIVSQTIAPREQVLASQGDVARGAALLNDTARLSCLQCHQFQSAGRAFGPDFKKACKAKTREQILDAILQPSREIAPEFVLHTVEYDDDELLSGIILKRTGDKIVLRDAAAADHEIAMGKVKSIRPQQLSAMPDGLLAGLSAQQVADLLEALAAEGTK
jgi:putative heme-binding domain-containing protein